MLLKGALSIWQNAIPGGHSLSIKDFICEIHFKDGDIEKEFVHKLANGDICVIPRNRPKLRVGAMPCIFNENADETEVDSSSPKLKYFYKNETENNEMSE